MSRKANRREFVDAKLGQHLALSVAAHLARTQLIADPLNVYEAKHLAESLDAVSNALLRVAPLYVKNIPNGEVRQLTEAELDGAQVKNAAQHLVMTDGRSLTGVCIKRADLRQAIAILKAVGIPGLTRATAAKENEVANGEVPDRMARLMGQVNEIGDLLRLPVSPDQAERANKLAIAIARSAPAGPVANLAMRLMSAIHDSQREADPQVVRTLLARLRGAVEDARSSDRV